MIWNMVDDNVLIYVNMIHFIYSYEVMMENSIFNDGNLLHFEDYDNELLMPNYQNMVFVIDFRTIQWGIDAFYDFLNELLHYFS